MSYTTTWILIGTAVYAALYFKKRRAEPENTKAYEKLPLIARIFGAVLFIIIWPLALLKLLSGDSGDGK